MAGENQICYFQLDSSYLRPSSSSTNRKTSDEPAEDCTSCDNFAPVFVVIDCGSSIASLDRFMIGKSSPSFKSAIRFEKRQSLTETYFLGAVAPVV